MFLHSLGSKKTPLKVVVRHFDLVCMTGFQATVTKQLSRYRSLQCITICVRAEGEVLCSKHIKPSFTFPSEFPELWISETRIETPKVGLMCFDQKSVCYETLTVCFQLFVFLWRIVQQFLSVHTDTLPYYFVLGSELGSAVQQMSINYYYCIKKPWFYFFRRERFPTPNQFLSQLQSNERSIVFVARCKQFNQVSFLLWKEKTMNQAFGNNSVIQNIFSVALALQLGFGTRSQTKNNLYLGLMAPGLDH